LTDSATSPVGRWRNLQERGRFRPEAALLFVPRRGLVHPGDGPVVAREGLFLVAKVPVGHGQEPFTAAGH